MELGESSINEMQPLLLTSLLSYTDFRGSPIPSRNELDRFSKGLANRTTKGRFRFLKRSLISSFVR